MKSFLVSVHIMKSVTNLMLQKVSFLKISQDFFISSENFIPSIPLKAYAMCTRKYQWKLMAHLHCMGLGTMVFYAFNVYPYTNTKKGTRKQQWGLMGSILIF